MLARWCEFVLLYIQKVADEMCDWCVMACVFVCIGPCAKEVTLGDVGGQGCIGRGLKMVWEM